MKILPILIAVVLICVPPAALGMIAYYEVEEPVEDGLQVEAGPPHRERRPPARPDLPLGGLEVRQVALDVVALGGLDQVDQVVRTRARSSVVGFAVPTSRPR